MDLGVRAMVQGYEKTTRYKKKTLEAAVKIVVDVFRIPTLYRDPKAVSWSEAEEGGDCQGRHHGRLGFPTGVARGPRSLSASESPRRRRESASEPSHRRRDGSTSRSWCTSSPKPRGESAPAESDGIFFGHSH